MKYCYIIFFLAATLNLQAQTQITGSSHTWHSSSGKDMRSGSLITATWTIVTDHQQAITLQDLNQTITFDVVSASGDFSDVAGDGYMDYQILYQNNIAGVIHLEKIGTVTTLLVDFRQSNPEGMYHQFSIDSVE